MKLINPQTFFNFLSYQTSTFWVIHKLSAHWIVQTIVGLKYDLKSNNLRYDTLGWWVDWMTKIDQASDVPSIIIFHNFLQDSLQNSFNLSLYNFTKIEIKSFKCPWVLRVQASNPLFYFQSIKIIVGPSNTWLMSWLTQGPSNLSYYIEDFQSISFSQ